MSPAVRSDLPRKRLLFLSTNCPYPIVDGHSQRTFNLLRGAAEDFDVHVLTFVQSEAEEEGVATLAAFCKEVVAIRPPTRCSRLRLLTTVLQSLASLRPFVVLKYRSREMESCVRERAARGAFDLLHLDMLPLASYRRLAARVPCVLVDHNVESILMRRRVSRERGLRKLFLALEWLKLRTYEARALGWVDRVVAVSENDRRDLLALSPGARVAVVENGVDTSYFAPTECDEEARTLVFVGSLRWFPNLDAVRYFAAEILPVIQADLPDVTLKVVGQLPDSVPALPAAVQLLGFVDDIRDVVSRSAVFVVPLRVGGGTRLKILNALSMGKAVVSTRIGSEGLALEAGEDIALADTPEKFGQEVVRLLGSPAERRRLGEQGRVTVTRRYRWGELSQKMNRLYEALLTKP